MMKITNGITDEDIMTADACKKRFQDETMGTRDPGGRVSQWNIMYQIGISIWRGTTTTSPLLLLQSWAPLLAGDIRAS